MSQASPTTATTDRFRRPRYFAVTYYAGPHALPDDRQHVFRSRKLSRA